MVFPGSCALAVFTHLFTWILHPILPSRCFSRTKSITQHFHSVCLLINKIINYFCSEIQNENVYSVACLSFVCTLVIFIFTYTLYICFSICIYVALLIVLFFSFFFSESHSYAVRTIQYQNFIESDVEKKFAQPLRVKEKSKEDWNSVKYSILNRCACLHAFRASHRPPNLNLNLRATLSIRKIRWINFRAYVLTGRSISFRGSHKVFVRVVTSLSILFSKRQVMYVAVAHHMLE